MRKRLYQRLLGPAWPTLAEPVQLLHATDVRGVGRFVITRGRGWWVSVLAVLARMPCANDAAETQLAVTTRAGEERWSRTFDGHQLESWQFRARDGEIAERFRILELRFRLEASDGALIYRPLGAALVFGRLRLRFPPAWAPRVEAREDSCGERQVHVRVRVMLPVGRTVLTYEGVIHLVGSGA